MVMTIAKITAGDGYLYLTRHVANGDADPEGKQDATDYYTAQGNPPGHWAGRGAPLLGLEGQEVTEDQMRALFGQGEHPDSDAIVRAYLREHVRGDMTERQLDEVTAAAIRHATLGRRFPAYEPLEQFDQRVQQRLAAIRQQAGRDPTQAEISKVKAEEARRQRAAVAGFDLVFSPVKSAALLWALDERPWVRAAIRQSHQNAMNEALELLEDHAAYTRTGTGGIAQIATNGLIAAAFEHWDSRAGDPNPHTHVAVSTKVQGADGKWRSLDARGLYRMTVAASEAYNTAFEAHLTRVLGVTFTDRPGAARHGEPVREIDGIPPGAIRYFSRRRAAIEARYAELLRAYRAAHGRDPPLAITGPAGYDCSGLVMKAYRAAGISLPRTTFQQVYAGSPVYSLTQLRPGDLIFIPGSDGTPAHPGHVGMYLGSGQVIEAPETGKRIMIVPLNGYWSQHAVALRRVI